MAGVWTEAMAVGTECRVWLETNLRKNWQEAMTNWLGEEELKNGEIGDKPGMYSLGGFCANGDLILVLETHYF